ncbi:MAG TPA: ArsA family ATPase [Jatrophihabitantaceae bacterium]|nr:ArsA family ATPase [Jatrophihabitantaceae bacterium]
MRIVFFTGKGGVGKTTVAAASALHSARRGIKTLLLSADAAHSVGDVVGTEVGREPTEISDGLYAAHLDAQHRLERSWETLQRRLRGWFESGGADPISAEELTVLPGVEEVLTLLAVRDHVRTGQVDAVLVDCGPSAETLRLLAVPDALSWYLERVLPAHRRWARRSRPLAGLLGASGQVPPDDLFDGVLALAEDLRSVREVVADPATSSVRLVLTGESTAVAEARRTRTALALYGYRLDGVVVNRVMPAGSGRWGAAWRAAQRAQFEVIDESFADLPVRRLPYLPAEPLGLDALGRMAAELYGTDDPLSGNNVDAGLRVAADEDQFVLTVGLPLADGADVDAARRGDDLILTVGGRRRLLALPSVLRRCTVASGRFAAGELVLRFDRDPALWPRGTASP